MNEFAYIRANTLPCARDRGLYTSCGDTVGYKYIELKDKNGMPHLEVKEKIDLVELHNADRESCDISKIVARFRQGDLTALMQGAQPFFDDMHSMPKTAMDMYNSLSYARSLFDSLPVEIKSEYMNNYTVWLEKCMSGDQKTLATLERFGVKFPVVESTEQITTQEVENNESEQ